MARRTARAETFALAAALLLGVAPRALAGEPAPGLEADACFPNRAAALAALDSGGRLTIQARILLDAPEGRELFEVLIRTSDGHAVLLDSRPEGVSCILIEGRSVPPTGVSAAP